MGWYGAYRLIPPGAGLCFVGLTATNTLLVLDKIVWPAVDLSPLRHSVTLVAMLVLLYGLIWNAE